MISNFNLLNELSTAKIVTQPIQISSVIYNPSVPPPNTINLTTAVASLRLPADTPKYYTTISLSDYSRLGLNEIRRTNITTNFVLPLPLKITDNNSVNYNDKFELGQIEGFLLGATQQKTIGEAGSQIFSREGLNVAVAGLSSELLALLSSAAALAGFDGVVPYINSVRNVITDIGAVTTGYSPNQFLTVLLEGPIYKRFELSFAISPNAGDESETLRKIKNILNNAMAPKMTASGGFFEFPKIFQVGYSNNSKYLCKYKPSVLINFSIDYAPEQQPAFYKESPETDNLNAPETVFINLTFMELEFWLRGDYKDNNDSSDTLGPRNQ
jgi:hypothetical protein